MTTHPDFQTRRVRLIFVLQLVTLLALVAHLLLAVVNLTGQWGLESRVQALEAQATASSKQGKP